MPRMATQTKRPPRKPGDSSPTPMMRQYLAIKKANPDTVLLYRMGDFYEMFNEDAKIASKVLGLTLTSRAHGSDDRTPLAGFPHHALDRYANRLVHSGYKIAICEQMEDPGTAKGVVKRDVVELITAGTATEDNFIDERSNNYIMAVAHRQDHAGVATCDLSTGEFFVEEIPLSQVEDEIVRLEPSEVLLPDADKEPVGRMLVNKFPKIVVSRTDTWEFETGRAQGVLKEHFGVLSLDGLGMEDLSLAVGAAGALLAYLKTQKKNALKHIAAIKPRRVSEFAELDPATIRNLELLRPLQTDDTDSTLVSVLDKTGTAMGARQLKRWITHPLKDIVAINRRLDCVAYLKSDVFARAQVERFLKSIADIERLIGRVTFERANARDLVGLKESLATFPSIISILAASQLEIIKKITSSLSGFESLVEKIGCTIVESPPLSTTEGGIIRPGISAELDEITDAATNGKQWIARLQQTERERLGVSSLKVGYNKVFGYYIELSKANLAAVPEDYIRKQTLVNGERFITPGLKEMEAKVLGAEEQLSKLEHVIFVALRTEIAKHCESIQTAAAAIATLDVFVSLARVAADRAYCRAVLRDDTEIHVREGRHPVLEYMNPAEKFVPNDADLDSTTAQILLITGPNMAGKSTYLRQNALIAIMAQMGSFVPAESAEIGVVDRFFTRVGASDRLARGMSTFLVEMIEVANILNNATDRSLVLLDEVGRGTSTFDGVSIAWAVAEHLHEHEGGKARTFFATHYHELTELPLLFPRIKNLHIEVREWDERIIFLRKIKNGSCDHSYGIQVARLAGVPATVVSRAKEILANLENMELSPEHKPLLARHRQSPVAPNTAEEQTDLFHGVQLNLLDSSGVEIMQQLRNLDINSMTPVDALNLLATLKTKAKAD